MLTRKIEQPRSRLVAVIGMDQGGNKYLLDGACHRMRFSERWALIEQRRLRWQAHSGVQNVSVGYEQ
jgi:hypothetical protein